MVVCRRLQLDFAEEPLSANGWREISAPSRKFGTRHAREDALAIVKKDDFT